MRKSLARLSRFVATLEKRAAAALCVLVFLLILTNMLVRIARIPLYWIDEAAIFSMIWMGFFAASYGVHAKKHVAVTLLSQALPAPMQWHLAWVTHLTMSLLGFALVAMAWVWFDPLQLIDAGGIEVFTRKTLNFVYTEPTASMGLPKFLFWLIMFIFSLSLTLHSLAHLVAPTEMQQLEGEAEPCQ